MAAAVLCLLTATLGAATVPVARDLPADGALAGERRIPILLLFTREDCGYCELLKRSVILPMIISGEYEGRVVIREVIVDDPGDLRDFAGRRVSPFAVADRYDALLTPTVLFVGPDGRALTERLVGINNEEMYLWYLDRALDDATTVLRGH
jgi:thioredoxin-related protein